MGHNASKVAVICVVEPGVSGEHEESPDLVSPPDDVLVHCGGVSSEPHAVLVPSRGSAALTQLLRCVEITDRGPRPTLLDHRSAVGQLADVVVLVLHLAHFCPGDEGVLLQHLCIILTPGNRDVKE